MQSHQSQILPRQSVQLKKSISSTSNSNTIDPSQQIADTFFKLNDTIDNLDTKVQTLLDKHQIQFLFAWQNHIKKIKNQLKQIKQRTDQKQKLLNSNERLVAMQKQMALFRDQSLRLYEQVEDRKSELQICKRRIKQQQNSLQILRQQNKQLIKTAKMSQAKSIIAQQNVTQIVKQLQKYKLNQQSVKNNYSNMNNNGKYEQLQPRINMLNNINVDNQNFITKQFSHIKSKTIGFDNFNPIKSNDKSKHILQPKHNTVSLKKQEVDNYSISKLKQQKIRRLSFTNKWQETNGFNTNADLVLQQQSIQKKPKMSLPTNNQIKTQYHSFMMIQPSLYQNQLKNWFLQCIKSIKKQISSRKTGFTSPAKQILKVQSLEEFKTIDKLRLLEMFLQNQKLLIYMYQKVFPDRMKEIETFLSFKTTQHQKDENKGDSIINHGFNKFESVKRDHIDENSFDMQILQQSKKSKNESKICVKSVNKSTKSQPIRNRIIMRDGKLNLIF